MAVETEAAGTATDVRASGPTVAVDVGGSTPVEALALADRLVVRESLAAQVGFLLEHVGPRVTWVALGLKDPRMLTKWWGGAEPKSDTKRDRIHLLFRACYAITAVFDGATAARFVRVASSYLDYTAPGDLLRSGPPKEVGPRFLAAAQHFLTA